MAIQWRQGNEADFDQSKMTSGEGAVFLDTLKAFIAFAPNIVKQLMTVEDAEVMLDIAVDEATAEAKGYAQNALIDATRAETYASNAQTSATTSGSNATAAQSSANSSSSSATLSRSWAVGGTGTRQGENTNNSSYFSNLAKSYSESSEASMQQAQALVDLATQSLASVTFDVDLDTGLLYQNTSEGTNINFTIDAEGVMYYEVEVA